MNKFTDYLNEAMANLTEKGAFLTSADGDKVNTMTISWGNVGFEWRMLIFIAMISMWLFPLQARFSNPIRATIRNAFYLSCKHLIRTIGMLIVVTLCALLWFVGARLFWIPLLVGISLPIYLCVLIYDKVFEKLEDTIKEAQKEEVEEGEPASVGEAEIPEVALEQIAEQNAGQDVEEISE